MKGRTRWAPRNVEPVRNGTQLCTKDGSRCGNARIMEVKHSEEPMSFLVRTDAGSEMVCTVNEIHEIWTIGPYFIKPVQAL